MLMAILTENNEAIWLRLKNGKLKITQGDNCIDLVGSTEIKDFARAMRKIADELEEEKQQRVHLNLYYWDTLSGGSLR